MVCLTGITLLALGLPELACYQVGGIGKTTAILIIAASLGMLIGLELPRWILSRRIKLSTQNPEQRSIVSFDFAAGLVGGLLLILAAIAFGAVFGLHHFESYRAWMVQRWGWPSSLRMVAITLPLIALAGGLGLVFATSMTALHGWYRLIAGTSSGFQRLWSAMFAGTVVGLGLFLSIESKRVRLVIALVAVCLSAGLATYRRRNVQLTRIADDRLQRISRRVRNVVLIAGGLSAVIFFWPTVTRSQPQPTPQLISDWLAPQATIWHSSDPTVWQLDLNGPKVGSLILIDDRPRPLWTDIPAVAKLAQRGWHKLLPNGRLIAVMPSPAAASAAEQWCRQARPRLRSNLWRIDLLQAAGTTTCILHDPGFAQWRSRIPPPDEWKLVITPLAQAPTTD
jgi:hypothetical protein